MMIGSELEHQDSTKNNEDEKGTTVDKEINIYREDEDEFSQTTDIEASDVSTDMEEIDTIAWIQQKCNDYNDNF